MRGLNYPLILLYLRGHTMYTKILKAPLLRSIIWAIILIMVVAYWPRYIDRPIEKEVIIKTHYIYVDRTNQVSEDEDWEMIFEPPVHEQKIARYGFTDEDIYLMTVLLSGSGSVSGDGEYDIDFGNQDNHDQISLVLSVVMNRVMSVPESHLYFTGNGKINISRERW